MQDRYYSLLGSTCDYLHVNEFIKILTLQISSDKFPIQCQILGNKFQSAPTPMTIGSSLKWVKNLITWKGLKPDKRTLTI